MEYLSYSKYLQLFEDTETVPIAPNDIEPSVDQPQPDTNLTDQPPISNPQPSYTSEPTPTDPFANSTLPPDQSTQLPEVEKSIKVVFLDSNKPYYYKYSDDIGVKRYNSYEIPMSELTSWIQSNNLSDKAQLIKDGLNGKLQLPGNILNKVHADIISKKLGKNVGLVDIQYDTNNKPSTSDLDLVFLNI